VPCVPLWGFAGFVIKLGLRDRLGSLHTLSTQALVDLYFFKEANPSQDIEAMLSSASMTFKNFIMRGLHKVGRDRGRVILMDLCCVYCSLKGTWVSAWLSCCEDTVLSYL
jgi:hypothetical protein